MSPTVDAAQQVSPVMSQKAGACARKAVRVQGMMISCSSTSSQSPVHLLLVVDVHPLLPLVGMTLCAAASLAPALFQEIRSATVPMATNHGIRSNKE